MLLGSRLTVALVTLPLLMAGTAFAGTDISVAPFKSIQLRGGGHVVLHHGPQQHVTLVNGSTQITHFEIVDGDTLRIDACNGHCPHHYDLEVDIVSSKIDGVAIDGGGKIESRGDFPKQGKIGAVVSGGGDIDIRTMSADEVDAAVNGGGQITTRVAHRLNAAVNGGGNISYEGDPVVTSAVNGGGSITKN